MRLPTVMLVACLAFCLLVTSCAEGYGTQVSSSQPRQDSTNPPTATATVPSLTIDALGNVKYAADLPTYWRLLNERIGRQDLVAFGDLNGDGIEDAAVVLLLADGNTGHRYLAAVLSENGEPRHVASAYLGINIWIDSAVIADGVVTLQMRQLGTNDSTCCPTREVKARMRLTEKSWQLLSETPLGQITSALRESPSSSSVDPPLDPELAHAFHTLRTTWKPAGEGIYQLFLGTGATAQFGPIAGNSQWQVSPSRIIIDESHRAESPVALAYALIWPTVALAFYTENGEPQSWEECIERITAQHTVQAQWWFSKWGASGSLIPTQLEREANNNLANFLDDHLNNWVRDSEHYRHYCAQFGESPSILPRSAVVAALSHRITEEMGMKEGTAAFSAMKGMLRRPIQNALWIYEGQYVMRNPDLVTPSLNHAIGEDAEREAFIRFWLNYPDEMRRAAVELRTWLYSSLSGKATGNVQDTGNAWLNSLWKADLDAFAYWVGNLEESFLRTLLPANLAEQYAPLRRRELVDQLGRFLYANSEDPDRTTGTSLLPEGWLK